jgi:hypothetical protein
VMYRHQAIVTQLGSKSLGRTLTQSCFPP